MCATFILDIDTYVYSLSGINEITLQKPNGLSFDQICGYFFNLDSFDSKHPI